MGTRDGLSITLYLQSFSVLSGCLSMPDATSLHHCLYRKEITYTLQTRFSKVVYRSVNVECPNSSQDNTILMMVQEAVM